jgi:uncharacterized protein YbjQ (UPF0145 family)
MIVCPKCQYVRQPHDTAPDYECPKCGVIYAKAIPVDNEVIKEKEAIKEKIKQAQISGDWGDVPPKYVPPERAHGFIQAIPVATIPNSPGRETDAIMGIVSAECAYGMNVFKDFFAGVSDAVGGRSATTQNAQRQARRTITGEHQAEAFSVGANAVVGVDFAYSELSCGGKSMLFVVATGTAVKLKPVDKCK